MDYKEIVILFEKLHLIRRIIHQKSIMDFPLYPGQLHLLEFVNTHEGCTQSEVAKHLMITPASVAVSTKRMEKSGLIEKRIRTDNLRCKRLYITEKGKKLSERCRKTINELDMVMFTGFSNRELNTLKDYLDRLFENITVKYSCNPDDIDFYSMLALRKKLNAKRKKELHND